MIYHSNNLFLQWWQGRCHRGWETPFSLLLSPVWSDRLGEEHKSGREGNGRHWSCQNLPSLLTFLPGFLEMTDSSTRFLSLLGGEGGAEWQQHERVARERKQLQSWCDNWGLQRFHPRWRSRVAVAWLQMPFSGESRAWMTFLVSGLFNLCEGGKTPKEGLEGMKIRLMLGPLWFGKFWVITTSNKPSPVTVFSLFYAKHRAAKGQWPAQLPYSSFVSPSH